MSKISCYFKALRMFPGLFEAFFPFDLDRHFSRFFCSLRLFFSSSNAPPPILGLPCRHYGSWFFLLSAVPSLIAMCIVFTPFHWHRMAENRALSQWGPQGQAGGGDANAFFASVFFAISILAKIEGFLYFLCIFCVFFSSNFWIFVGIFNME